ncbi:dormancy-associated protein homolog 4-like [Lycium barbarum]|uniref:dormancy-associated protein homolog 4-like n=1 Tax=Lycium barbarum TaxID=112863 RepID=UPI00293E6D51|nr:dormancy-associated protein homolog 4-like [Lycium barbarum]
MGFLHKLWDETLAGPAPDSGLGKLRKYNSFAGRATSTPPSPTKVGRHHHGGGADIDDLIPVSRSITILRSNSTSAARCGNVTPDSGSVPSSPATSSASNSPFAPSSPRRNFKKKPKGKANTEPSPNYDWIVLSAWDR